MSDETQADSSMQGGSVGDGAEPKQSRTRWLPMTGWGWWSVGLTVVLLLEVFVVLPLRITFLQIPGPDSWVGAVMAMVWIDAVAALSLVAVFRKGERSVSAILMLAASVLIGVFFTLSVVGGAITGQ